MGGAPALLIVNQKYRDIPGLGGEYSERVSRLEQLLFQKGYVTDVVTNASNGNMQQACEQFVGDVLGCCRGSQAASPRFQPPAVFIYCGLATSCPSRNGDSGSNILLGVDSAIGDVQNGNVAVFVEVAKLARALGGASCSTLMVLDCCRKVDGVVGLGRMDGLPDAVGLIQAAQPQRACNDTEFISAFSEALQADLTDIPALLSSVTMGVRARTGGAVVPFTKPCIGSLPKNRRTSLVAKGYEDPLNATYPPHRPLSARMDRREIVNLIPSAGQEVMGMSSPGLEVRRQVGPASPDGKDVATHCRDAFSMWGRGDFGGSEKEYRKALELDPKDTTALCGLALLLYEIRRDFDQAELKYRECLSVDPHHASALTGLADLIQEHKGDVDAAEHLYRRAIASNPKLGAALYHYGCLLADQRHAYEEAASYYEKALECEPNNAAILYGYASFLNAPEGVHRLVDREQAEKLYTRAIKSDPHLTGALLDLGLLYKNYFLEHETAARLLQQAKSKEPNNEEITEALKAVTQDVNKELAERHKATADQAWENGDYDEAEHAYKEALHAEPQNWGALYRYGMFVHKVRSLPRLAERLYARAVEFAPSTLQLSTYPELVEAVSRRAEGGSGRTPNELRKRSSNPIDLLSDLELMAEIRRTSSSGDLDKAEACLESAKKAMERGEHDQAEAQLKEALRVDPYNSMAKLEHGIYLYEVKGNTEAAELLWEEAIEINPTNVQALYRYGRMLEEDKKNTQGARRYYQRGLEVDPNNKDLLEALKRTVSVANRDVCTRMLRDGKIAREAGNFDTASRLLSRAVDSDPSNGDALFELADLYDENGDFELAEPLVARSDQLEMRTPRGHYLRGKFKQKAGNMEDALVSLTESLSMDDNSDAKELLAKMKAVEDTKANSRMSPHSSPRQRRRTSFVRRDSWSKEREAAERLSRDATKARHAGQWDTAEKLWQEAIGKDPENSNALYQYAAFLYEIRRNFEGAEHYWERAIAANPLNSYALSNQATLHFEVKKDYDTSEALFMRAIEADPQNVYAKNGYGALLYEVRKDNEKAEKLWRDALEENPKHGDALCNLATLLYDVHKDVDKAVEILKESLDHNPRHVASLCKMGCILRDVDEDYEEARSCFERAVECDENNVNTMYCLARLLHKTYKDYPTAESLYKRILELNPSHCETLTSYGVLVEFVSKDYSEAERLYQKALHIKPDDAFALNSYADLLYEVKKDYQQAKSLYLKAIEVDSENVYAMYSVADLLYEVMHNNDEAEKYYRMAVETDPNNSKALYRYGLFLEYVVQDLEEAEELYGRAIESDPCYSKALYHYGLLQEEQGDLRCALTHYERAVKSDEGNAPALYSCALLLERMRGDLIQAAKLLRKAVEVDPDEASYRSALKRVEDVLGPEGVATSKGEGRPASAASSNGGFKFLPQRFISR